MEQMAYTAVGQTAMAANIQHHSALKAITGQAWIGQMAACSLGWHKQWDSSMHVGLSSAEEQL